MSATTAPLARTDVRAGILAGLVLAIIAFAAAVVPPITAPAANGPAAAPTHYAAPVNHAGKKP